MSDELPDVIYVQFTKMSVGGDLTTAIREWSCEPFEGATEYRAPDTALVEALRDCKKYCGAMTASFERRIDALLEKAKP